MSAINPNTGFPPPLPSYSSVASSIIASPTRRGFNDSTDSELHFMLPFCPPPNYQSTEINEYSNDETLSTPLSSSILDDSFDTYAGSLCSGDIAPQLPHTRNCLQDPCSQYSDQIQSSDQKLGERHLGAYNQYNCTNNTPFRQRPKHSNRDILRGFLPSNFADNTPLFDGYHYRRNNQLLAGARGGKYLDALKREGIGVFALNDQLASLRFDQNHTNYVFKFKEFRNFLQPNPELEADDDYPLPNEIGEEVDFIIDNMRRFGKCFPVQGVATSLILHDYDVILLSPTATGKTFAWGAPVIMRTLAWLIYDGNRPMLRKINSTPRIQPTVLVLVNSRELARQIYDDLHTIAYRSGVAIQPLYGGTDRETVLDQFKICGADIIVATVGRLMHCIFHNDVFVDKVRCIVYEEADALFENDDINKIEEYIKKQQNFKMEKAEGTELKRIQTIVVSGQLADVTNNIICKVDPTRALVIRVNTAGSIPFPIKLEFEPIYTNDIKGNFHMIEKRTDDGITVLKEVQAFYNPEKANRLAELIKNKYPEGPPNNPVAPGMIVFFNRKVDLIETFDKYFANSPLVTCVHGNMSQMERELALQGDFQTRARPVLLTTNLLAHGFDDVYVDEVVNYDMPCYYNMLQTFIARNGRCGRIGRVGKTRTFINVPVSEKEHELISKIGAILRVRSQGEQLPDFLSSVKESYDQDNGKNNMTDYPEILLDRTERISLNSETKQRNVVFVDSNN